MYMGNICLDEAMSKTSNFRVRMWELPGSHVEVADIPENAAITKTFVAKNLDNQWQVGIEFMIDGNLSSKMNAIAEFSTLDELKANYPQFSEIPGDLYALI